MKKLATYGVKPHDAGMKADGQKWSLMEKLLLGLPLDQYIGQALRNKLNWILGFIFAIGVPVILYRFVFSLGAITHGSYDYPWGLFLGFGLFCMVPLSASGFITCDWNWRHIFAQRGQYVAIFNNNIVFQDPFRSTPSPADQAAYSSGKWPNLRQYSSQSARNPLT